MSKQATIGESPDAAELDASNRQISVAEFFEKNKHMLGFGSESRALFTALKEALDNSLDATEEAGHLPGLYAELREDGDYYTLVVEDNGPGVTRDEIPNVFGKLLYGSRFASRSQSRGQQGIGISAAVLYSQLTTGEPARITSKTASKDTAQYFELIIDTDNNEPDIKTHEQREWDKDHGTRIELKLEGNLRSRNRIIKYIKRTATVNPHASVEYNGPKETLSFDRVTDELPPETEEIPPHPHGVELGTLMKMLDATSSHSLSGFLQNEFTRVGKKTAENILNEFRDHYYGRQPVWAVPDTEEDELADAIEDAVANKGADATREFAENTAASLRDAEQVSISDVKAIVADESDSIENGFTVRFGSTVRKKAADAAWSVIRETRAETFTPLIDEVTSKRKTKATITGVADRLASKFDTDDTPVRVTRTDLRNYIERAADATEDYEDATVGDTAREKITDAVWSHFQTVDEDVPKIREVAQDRDLADYLLESMRETDVIAPPTDCLSPIQPDKIEAGMKDVYSGADFYTAATRDASVHGGDPFIVEAGIAYGGDLKAEQDKQRVDVNRFANRVPLVYQQGACAITDVIKDIGWRNYNLSQSGGKSLPKGPAVIVVHVASTNVPFTSESKDAVANVPEIEKEAERAVREAARDLKDYLNKQKSLKKRREKRNVVADILPKIEEKVTNMVGDERPGNRESLARIMNNLYVGTTDDGTTIQVQNHANSGSERPELAITVESSPDVEDVTASTGSVASPDVESDGDEWVVEWEPKVPNGGYARLTLDVSPADVTCGNIPDEKVTFDQNIDN